MHSAIDLSQQEKRYSDIATDETAMNARSILASKWGIQCPDDCVYRSAKRILTVSKARKLDEKIQQLGSMGNNVGALKDVEKLLVLHAQLNSSAITIKRTLYDGLQIRIMSKATLKKGMEYIKKDVEIGKHLLHPSSIENLRRESYLNNPSSHRNYLLR